ncbi:MAG TPA: hypothetical protein VHE30_20260 [Polyangiaceae bacterium]|nr:hypothetical protein [Polyangiaceae bacterium]
MNDLDDDHLDAFFHAGDTGAYEGGPTHAASLVPLTVDEFDGSETDRGPTPEQLERRARYKRLVTRFVGTLGAVSLLGVVIRASQSREDVAASNHAAAPAAKTEPAAEVAAPRPEPRREEAVPSSVLALAATEPAGTPVPAPEVSPKGPVAKAEVAKVAPKTESVPNAAPKTVAARPSVHAETARAISASSVEVPKTESASLRPAVVTTSTSTRKSSGAPPTATFPD